MQNRRSTALSRVLAILAAILILKTTLSVLIEYRHYFPPNFQADFLRGRQSYFWGAYRWAFYTHLISGPTCLLLGGVLVSERFRLARPRWHRRLGRVQVACILLLLTPSGLWMARYAESGGVAAMGLASLGIATTACVTLGWRAAVARQFANHRRWMGRTFMLLCSAVLIRMIGGLATIAEFDAAWLYPVSVWVSWLLPLAIFECWQLLERRAGDGIVVSVN